MKQSRIKLAVFVVSALVASIVAPLSASAQGVPGVGTTSSSLQLVDVTLTEVPQLGQISASLGLATADATTVGDTLASVLFNGVTVAGQTSGLQQVSSSDGVDSQDVSVPLAGPGIDGNLTVAKLSAEATADSAIALLSALSGNVNVGPLGLAATVGDNGINSQVVKDLASSRTGAGIGPIELKVGDLLPDELLGALPLSALLDLTDGLNLDLGAILGAQVQALRDVLATVDTLQAKLDELAAAEANLSQLVGGNDALLAQIEAAQANVDDAEAAVAAAQAALATAQGSVTAAQTQISTLQTEVATLQSDLAAAETLLAACPSLCAPLQAMVDTLNAEIATVNAEIAAAQTQLAQAQANVTTEQADLAAAQAQLAAAQAALDALLVGLDAGAIEAAQALVNTLQALIDDLLAQLQALLAGLPDLSTLIDQLVGLLGDAPLLSVDRLSLAVKSAADSIKGTADVNCGATGVSVLGQSLGTLTCGQLSNKFDELTGGIMDVLKSLPVVGGAVPSITVKGLNSKTSASDAPDANGVTSSMASLSALEISIPSVELGALIDTLVADAIAQIEDVVAGLPAGSAEIQGLLNTVKAQLSVLPTGAALEGLNTVGIDAVLGGLTSRSSFQASARPATTPPPAVDPPTNPQPQNRAPQPQAQAAPLPFTGQGSLPIALAVWMVVIGGLLLVSTQRAKTGLRAEGNTES